MAVSQIHCDFYEVFGPDWTRIGKDEATTIVRQIETMELVGREPDRCGFVGTASLSTIVGGFFAIQYMAELLHYDAHKNPTKKTDTPFERLFFVLFAQSGKFVLQNRKFADLPLSMEMATRRVTEALSLALQLSKVGYVLGLSSPTEKRVEPEIFRSEFRQSSRVDRLSVDSPDAGRIPEGFVYFNPQIKHNQIIRESHQHDYPNFQKVDLEASINGDLKETHFAKDLVESGTPTLMKYSIGGREQVLRRTMPKKFQIYVDVDAEELDQGTLNTVVELLRTDIGLPVDIPVAPGQQPLLLGYSGESENENDQE